LVNDEKLLLAVTVRSSGIDQGSLIHIGFAVARDEDGKSTFHVVGPFFRTEYGASVYQWGGIGFVAQLDGDLFGNLGINPNKDNVFALILLESLVTEKVKGLGRFVGVGSVVREFKPFLLQSHKKLVWRQFIRVDITQVVRSTNRWTVIPKLANLGSRRIRRNLFSVDSAYVH
jgi:hypothetical protein